MMLWDALVCLVEVPRASGVFRVCFRSFWATLDADFLISGVVLRVREEPLAFAKKDLTSGILFISVAIV